MKEHYIRLLTDIELNSIQKHVWYQAVEKFLDEDHSPEPENFTNQLASSAPEFKSDAEFPYVYIVYLDSKLDIKRAELIVKLWQKIYPRDFEIETSAEYDCETGECTVEINDAMHEEIQKRASKFLHNRWVEEQISEGWRFGLKKNTMEQVSPRLRDWDSLNEQYRKELDMTREQAVDFFKKYPHFFV